MESAVENPVVVRAERDGWFVRKLGWIGRRGAPDRLFIRCGRVVFIEFKDRGKEPTLLQKQEHKRMLQSGAEVYVCDSPIDALAILNRGNPPDKKSQYEIALERIAGGANDARRVAMEALGWI